MPKKGSFKANGRWYTKDSGLTTGDKRGLVEVRENNTQLIQRKIRKGTIQAMEKIGLACEGYAKKLCPVDTGRLRNSITHLLLDEKNVIVGTNVEYATYVETGTSKHREQPFLRPAALNHTKTYNKIFHNAIGK